MKYIVITYQATGNCWMNYFKEFDSQEDAVQYADEKGGAVIQTDFFYKSESFSS
jgi:hypothetical protein